MRATYTNVPPHRVNGRGRGTKDCDLGATGTLLSLTACLPRRRTLGAFIERSP